jgi:hypothetical protein
VLLHFPGAHDNPIDFRQLMGHTPTAPPLGQQLTYLSSETDPNSAEFALVPIRRSGDNAASSKAPAPKMKGEMDVAM